MDIAYYWPCGAFPSLINSDAKTLKGSAVIERNAPRQELIWLRKFRFIDSKQSRPIPLQPSVRRPIHVSVGSNKVELHWRSADARIQLDANCSTGETDLEDGFPGFPTIPKNGMSLPFLDRPKLGGILRVEGGRCGVLLAIGGGCSGFAIEYNRPLDLN